MNSMVHIVGAVIGIIGLVGVLVCVFRLLLIFGDLCQKVDEIHAKLFTKDDEPPTER